MPVVVLGLVLGIWALYALKQDIGFFCAWIICLGVFIVDATFTLIRRVLNGHKMYDAHRSHAYQYASRKYQSHTKATLGVLTINLLWLLPMAYLAVTKVIIPELVIAIAYFPLIVLAIYFKAGKQKMSNKNTLLILGAGGHGKSVAEAASLSGKWESIIFADDAWPEKRSFMVTQC